MCGIVGVLKMRSSARLGLSAETANRMVQALRYRGPDGQDQWTSPDGNCWLGHTRLAIVDLAGGHQPMSNEDGSVWVTFNGEIYNHLDIHRELVSLGHQFRTRCDTEILVHGYEQWGGEGLVQRLRGMFAFALYDSHRRTLFLARDRLGIKPLYWWSDGEVFLFASEIKALLAYPKLSNRQVDPNALSQFLTFRYVPNPLTMFRDIWKLPAGHGLQIDVDQSGGIAPKRYWDVTFARHDPMPDFEQALEEVDRLLRESVRLRLMAEVPLGAQLSGGVDSSLIVAQMERLRQEAGNGERVRTFSIGFADRGFSELGYARQIARRYGTEHHEVIVGFDDFVDQFARLCWVYDEPVSEPPAIPTYLLCRFAKQHVTVMLTGEGGDELFAGYPKCAADLYSRYLDWMPSSARRGMLRAAASALPFTGRRLRIALENLSLSDPAQRYASWFSAFDTVDLPRLLRKSFRASLTDGGAAARVRQELARCASDEPLDRMLYSDLHTWLVDDLLVKGDRMSMASGVEARVPMLDHKLVEYAAGLPPHYKAHGRRTKILLKKLAERYMPREAIYRRKVGFTVPLGPWFLGPLRPFVEGMLLDERSLSRGYYEPEALRRVVEDHMERRVDRGRSLWTLLAVEIWHRLFVDDDGTEAASERLHGELLSSLACHAPR
jgi:asparagine synthase (glutamine-hydrolysing)